MGDPVGIGLAGDPSSLDAPSVSTPSSLVETSVLGFATKTISAVDPCVGFVVMGCVVVGLSVTELTVCCLVGLFEGFFCSFVGLFVDSLDVEPTDGATVSLIVEGDALGPPVVGLLKGPELGLLVYLSEGLKLGSSLGFFDRAAVDGTKAGLKCGCSVGLSVTGIGDGCSVGLSVTGLGVGCLVGIFVTDF